MPADRRHFLALASSVSLVSLAGCARSGTCPICKSSLSTIGRAWYWIDKEEKNLNVWNGSYHGVQGFEDYSPICPRCYVALRAWDNTWVRSVERPEAFYLPLEEGIRNVPLPPRADIHYKIVYSQEFKHLPQGTDCIESVSFWCDLKPAAEAALQQYADGRNLSLELDKRSGAPDCHVRVAEYLPNKSLERTRGR